MRISDWSSDVCSSDLLTTAMAAAQQAAQHAVTAARTSYEKVTGSPFQDIGRLDDYAADVVRALGDVDLLKSHFTGRALGEIDRSEERRGGKECVSTCRFRRSSFH